MTTEQTRDPRAATRPATTRGGRLRSRRRRRIASLAMLAPAAAALAIVIPAHPGAAGTAAPAAAPAALAPAPTAAVEVAATPVDVATHTPSDGHRVSPGETLSGIAVRYGTTVAALAGANGLGDADLIIPGTGLTVPVAGSSSTAGLPARLAASPTRLSYRPTFAYWAAANGIPLDLLEAMTWLESGWQNHLVSPHGAMGIGQLLPGTVEHVEQLIGVDLDPTVVDDNIRMAARYLRWLLARTSSTDDALAGYYQGLASVQANGHFSDTETYVANVLALRRRF